VQVKGPVGRWANWWRSIPTDATSAKVRFTTTVPQPIAVLKEILFTTDLVRTDSEQYKSTAEAALDAARVILRQCADSKTVKRVIHTGTMATCSPLKEDSTGFKDAVDESMCVACAETPEQIPIETGNLNSLLSRHSRPRRRR
jgi:hypothetical protein